MRRAMWWTPISDKALKTTVISTKWKISKQNISNNCVSQKALSISVGGPGHMDTRYHGNARCLCKSRMHHQRKVALWTVLDYHFKCFFIKEASFLPQAFSVRTNYYEKFDILNTQHSRNLCRSSFSASSIHFSGSWKGAFCILATECRGSHWIQSHHFTDEKNEAPTTAQPFAQGHKRADLTE